MQISTDRVLQILKRKRKFAFRRETKIALDAAIEALQNDPKAQALRLVALKVENANLRGGIRAMSSIAETLMPPTEFLNNGS